MTKKHFAAIAAEFAELNKHAELDPKTLYEAAYRLCVVFKEFNGNFDRDRFMKACGF